MQFLINHGTPKDKRMANELAPRELDTPIPLSPVRKENINFTNKGYIDSKDDF